MTKIDTIVIAVGGQGRRIASDLKKRRIKSSKIFLKFRDKSILSHLIDMSLDLNFQRIFLLSSYYERELHSFLRRNHSTTKQIMAICGGKLGRKWGVPWLLYSIKKKLHSPFVYSDGNILYSKSILKKIKNVGVIKPAIANVVLSRKNLAPTHSRFIVQRDQVEFINTRLPYKKRKRDYSKGQQRYSLGLMVLSELIFSSVPRFAYKKDLDFVINDIFESDKRFVRVTKYSGNWIAIHTIHDVDKLGIKG